MPSICPVQEILQLLEELEKRALADPKLAAEWELARNQFPHAQWLEEDHWRFREWFLLERKSDALGSPPILAWSPDSLDEKDVWSRLMDSLMGVFVSNGKQRQDDGGELLELSELWTGRSVTVLDEQASALLAAPEDSIFLGRFVMATDPFFAPLPGVRMASAPGLIPALERDLAAARAAHSRARLSQLELEKLCNWVPANADPNLHDSSDIEPRITDILESEPDWDLLKLQLSLAEVGLGETLNRIAFDTKLDLEELRRILPEYEQSLRQQAEQTAAKQVISRGQQFLQKATRSADPEVPATTQIDHALKGFDLGRSSGASLDQSFAELEQALGLPTGISAEPGFTTGDDHDPVGFTPMGGIRLWMDAYAWERLGAESAPPELQQMAEFLKAQDLAAIEAEDLTATAILPYLLAAGQPHAIRARNTEIRGFLDWAESEQGALLGPLAIANADAFLDRIVTVLELNAKLAANGTWQQQTRVVAVKPLAVATDEQNETASVIGVPAKFAGVLEIADILLGRWKAGCFIAMGALPKEAAPDSKEPAE